jgi:nudix-type nucleoside diphosphatase (YffH/AdpP family)
MNKRVTIQREVRLLDDYFGVDEAHFRYELFSGGMSPPVRRLTLERGDSAGAILVDSTTKKVLLIEQFRYPTYKKGPGWLIEVVAGIIGHGETAEEALRREVVEEMGFAVERLCLIGQFYLSPGGSSERITLYIGHVSSSTRIAGGGGVPEDGEDIRIVEYSIQELRTQLTERRIQDAKTVIACMWLLCHERELGWPAEVCEGART